MHNLARSREVWSLLIVALLVAGCSSTPSAPKRQRAITSPPKTSSVPKTSVSPVPRAKNGSDVNACRYADCEIVVNRAVGIPLDPKFGVFRFGVLYTSPNKVTIRVARAVPTDMKAMIEGTGYLRLASGLTVIVENFDASGAVLRFSPRPVTVDSSAPIVTDKNNDKGAGTDGFLLSSS